MDLITTVDCIPILRGRLPVVVVAERLLNDEPLRENGAPSKVNSPRFAVFLVFTMFDNPWKKKLMILGILAAGEMFY